MHVCDEGDEMFQNTALPCNMHIKLTSTCMCSDNIRLIKWPVAPQLPVCITRRRPLESTTTAFRPRPGAGWHVMSINLPFKLVAARGRALLLALLVCLCHPSPSSKPLLRQTGLSLPQKHAFSKIPLPWSWRVQKLFRHPAFRHL